MHDDAAALHLFRVSAGLDSLIPGESEILGQVRAAFDAASPGPLLDRVFRQALSARQARPHRDRDRREPGLGAVCRRRARRAGVRRPQAAARCCSSGRAGSASSRPANLSARGASIAYVANRTPESAAELATRFGGAPIALDDVALEARRGRRRAHARPRPRGSLIAAADVPSRRRHPLFFIDIAVPRDVDPAVHELDGCFLYDIDDLEAVVAETPRGPPCRGRGRRAARRAGDRAIPRVAGVARRRPGDLVAARPRARRSAPPSSRSSRRCPRGSANVSSR